MPSGVRGLMLRMRRITRRAEGRRNREGRTELAQSGACSFHLCRYGRLRFSGLSASVGELRHLGRPASLVVTRPSCPDFFLFVRTDGPGWRATETGTVLRITQSRDVSVMGGVVGRGDVDRESQSLRGFRARSESNSSYVKTIKRRSKTF